MKQKIKEKGRHPVGIKWKLFAMLSLFTAVILLILWLSQVVFLEDIYRTIKTAEIRLTAKELTAYVNNIDRLSSKADRMAEDKDVCILVLRVTGFGDVTLLKSCDVLKNCTIHSVNDAGIFSLYQMAKESGGRLLQHYRYDAQKRSYIAIRDGQNQGDPESIIYSLVVKDSNGEDVLFLFNSVVSPVGATVRTLNILLIFVSVLMLLLALLLAILLSKRISKPLVNINESAKALGAGNYGVRFCGGSLKETTELADTLNYAARELSKVDGLRRELIANTSHDLRTPLTMISGYAEVMRDLPGENTPENAQIIIDEAKRLSSLVNDMLDISKLESGNQPVNREIFDLTDTVARGLERYNQFRQREGYRIDFLFDRHVIVCTDVSKFMQAFYNIVNNAITYTGEDKRVTVTQSVYNDSNGTSWVTVSVTDTGEGIPEDKLSLIWDRYYKIDSNHRRSAQGSGLGLSIVRKIMDLIGGRCSASSKPGEGSTFLIEIPTYYKES